MCRRCTLFPPRPKPRGKAPAGSQVAYSVAAALPSPCAQLAHQNLRKLSHFLSTAVTAARPRLYSLSAQRRTSSLLPTTEG
jgi:hypothetical protein